MSVMRESLAWAQRLYAGPMALMLLGAVPQVWLYVVQQRVTSDPLLLTTLYISFSAALFMLAFLGRSGRVPQGLVAAVAAAAPMAALPPLLAVGDCAAMGLFCALAGVGAAWWFASWFALYSSRGLRDGVAYVLLSFATAAPVCAAADALWFLSSSMGPLLVGALIVSMPLAWRHLFAVGVRDVQRPSPVCSPIDRRRLVAVSAEFVVFGVLLGFLQGSGPEASGDHALAWGALLCRSFVPLLIYLWASVRSGSGGFVSVSQVVLLVIALIFMMMGVMGDAASPAVAALASVARNSVLAMLSVALLYASRAKVLSAFVAYGLGRGVHAVCTLCGILLSTWAGSFSEFAVPLNIFLFAVAAVFLVLGINSAQAVDLIGNMAGETGKAPLNSAEPSIEALCAQLASRCGMTSREEEVLGLLARGRTRPYIAERLCISESTVKFHCRNVYEKAGVHDRQELLDLLGVD